MKQVKVFGERNTGTNYVSDMIAQNFSARILSGGPAYWWESRFGLSSLSMSTYFLLTGWRNLGWKHAVPKLSQRQTQRRCFVVITKNPYAWLLSLHKRPYHNLNARNLPFNEFLNTPWPLMRCDQVNAETVTPVDLWNIKNKSYIKLADNVTTSLATSYEAIVDDPEKFLYELAAVMGLPLKNELILQRKGSKSVDKNKSYDQYREFYLNELWKDKLTNDDISLINKSLDTELVDKLGYSLL